MSINYRSITATVIAAADKKPGHSDVVLFAPTSSFDTIAIPTAPFTAMGATKKITANHTFPVNGGWKSIQAKAKSIDGTADAAGEAGGQVITYKYKVIVKGDSAEINEFIENLANEDIIALLNDPVCGVDNYVQLGSACTPANISGLAYRSGSKGAGGFKEYEFVIESSDKFFYEGDVTMASEDPTLDAPGLLSISAVTDDGFVVNWADVTDATGYDIDTATNAGFTTGVVSYDRSVSDVTVSGLTAATVYYIRVRAKATGFNSSSYTSFSITTLA
jgi:hypothetical protein